MRILFTRDLSTADTLIQGLSHEHEVGVLSIRSQALGVRMHNVHVMPVTERPQWLIKGIGFLNSETVPPVYLSGFAAAVQTFRPDVLVLMECNRFDLFQALRYVRKNPSCRLVLWTETKRLPQRMITRLALQAFLWVVRSNIQRFSGVITYTGEGAAFWRKRVVGRMPVTVIPSVIDTECFHPEPQKTWMPGGILRIVMNARFVPYKRHRDLLAALALLRERGVAFSATLIGARGHGRENVEGQVAQYGLTEQVTFLDPLPHEEMQRLLAAHDVLVLPSYNEALGLVVPEALASGIPTITSDTVGANVYVEEGKTGYVFKTYDVTALADSLERIAAPEILADMGHAARERMIHHFTKETLLSKFLDSV